MMTFEQAKELIHRRLDGEVLSAEQNAALDAHLAEHPEARALADELSLVQGALSGLDLPAFPDNALDAILRQTVAAETVAADKSLPVTPSDRNTTTNVRATAPSWGGGRTRWFSAVAAVAAMAVVAVGAWWFQPAEPEPTPEEVARQLEMVFKTTSNAIDRTAIRSVEVLSDELTPALKKIPLLFESAKPAPTGEQS